MKKIELEIVALSHSITQTHSYAVVLGEVNGLRRLPIVIGGFEAQAIAVALERMSPSRPLTHDLMKNFMMAFNVELHEVVINDLQEGILMENDDKKKKTSAPVTTETGGQDDLHKLSLEELHTLLNEVLEQEDYIRAIAIRDEIKLRK